KAAVDLLHADADVLPGPGPGEVEVLDERVGHALEVHRRVGGAEAGAARPVQRQSAHVVKRQAVGAAAVIIAGQLHLVVVVVIDGDEPILRDPAAYRVIAAIALLLHTVAHLPRPAPGDVEVFDQRVAHALKGHRNDGAVQAGAARPVQGQSA